MRLKIRKRRSLMDSSLLLYLILFSLFKPYNVSLWPSINRFLMIVKVVGMIILLGYFIINNRITMFLVENIIFVAFIIFSTYINKGNFSTIQEWLSIIFCVLLFDCMYRKKNLSLLMQKCYNVFFLWIVINTYTVLKNTLLFAINPNMYDVYFLGGDNYFAFICIAMLGCMNAYDYYEYKKTRKLTIIAWILVLVSLLYNLTVAGLVSCIIMSILFVIKKWHAVWKMLNIKIIIVIIAFICVAVSYFHIERFFELVLINLGKGTTLSGRAIIWPGAIDIIKNNLLIGVGEQKDIYFIKQFGGANHCHNIILQSLVTGGIIGTILFINVIFKASKSLNGRLKTQYEQALLISLAVYCICGIFDFYITLIYFYAILNFMYYLGKEEKNKEKKI